MEQSFIFQNVQLTHNSQSQKIQLSHSLLKVCFVEFFQIYTLTLIILSINELNVSNDKLDNLDNLEFILFRIQQINDNEIE